MDANFVEYCITSGVLDRDAVKSVLAKSESNTSLYKTLIQSGLISQDQLAISAGDYYQCPVVDISKVTPNTKALSYGSGSVCRRYGFLPFAVDPVVGLLVAISDYAQLHAVTTFLKDARVERMKFYIASYDTLLHTIQTYYGADNGLPEISSTMGPLRRRPSILRTQYGDLDPQPYEHEISSLQSDRRLQQIMSELSACKDDNRALRQRIEQLSVTVELEASMLRELAKVLKSTGVIDVQNFERWLLSQR